MSGESLPMNGPTAPSSLDADQVVLAGVARDWLAERAPTSLTRTMIDAGSVALPEFWDSLVELGWIALAVDESLGGQGGTLSDLVVVLEEWGRGAAPGPFPSSAAVAFLLGHMAGLGHISPDHLGPILAGEPAAIVVDPDEPVDGAAVAEWFLVPHGSTWELRSRSGVEVSPLSWADPARGAARVAVLAERSAMPEDSVVADFEDPDGLVRRVVELVRSAECVGVASWCVHTAAEYARTRVQFGRPIGQFQAVKHRCANALCRLEEARALVWDASRLEPTSEEFSGAVAMASAVAPEAAFECAKDAIQVLGGMGYTWEHDAHLYLRRATVAHHLNGVGAEATREVARRALEGERRHLQIELPEGAEAARSEVSAFIEELRSEDKFTWNHRLADGGWIAPHWPRPWGRDADGATQVVIDQEFRRERIRRPHLAVAGWVVPTLIAHGTPDQQQRFIPASMRQEIQWCQMFSEPGAGSDLASLTTRAERTDGGWSLSGQKVWTTMAHTADWGICLARTDPDAESHAGITCFLVDMKSEGLDIRPLRELTGMAMFNEVFLDEVFVPDELVVGPINGGWECARTTLANERVSMSEGSSFGPGLEAVADLMRRSAPDPTGAGRTGADTSALLPEFGELVCTAGALAVMGLRTAMRAVGGASVSAEPGPESSVAKLIAVEHEQHVQEMGMALLGASAMDLDGEGALWFGGFLGNRALSIAGGTSEIQRNVIAERLLGLPKD